MPYPYSILSHPHFFLFGPTYIKVLEKSNTQEAKENTAKNPQCSEHTSHTGVKDLGGAAGGDLCKKSSDAGRKSDNRTEEPARTTQGAAATTRERKRKKRKSARETVGMAKATEGYSTQNVRRGGAADAGCCREGATKMKSTFDRRSRVGPEHLMIV